MKNIPLTQGQFALVDDEDFEWLSQWKWQAQKARKTFYAKRDSWSGGIKTTVFMHRVIEGTSHSLDTDHRDGNGLNNQKSNLRSCTGQQNRCNRGVQKNNTSGYKGVSWKSSRGKWEVKISSNRKEIFIGRFTDIVDAARAYDEAARKLHGEFANLNLPMPH